MRQTLVKKTRVILFALSVSWFLHSCSSSNTLEDKLGGTWMVESISSISRYDKDDVLNTSLFRLLKPKCQIYFSPKDLVILKDSIGNVIAKGKFEAFDKYEEVIIQISDDKKFQEGRHDKKAKEGYLVREITKDKLRLTIEFLATNKIVLVKMKEE